jgi:hypothetical protein
VGAELTEPPNDFTQVINTLADGCGYRCKLVQNSESLRTNTMTLKLLLVLVLTASLGAPVGYIFYRSNLSSDNWVYRGSNPTNWKDGV